MVKKMWWLMLFPGNMKKKKGPSSPSHSLSPTGLMFFTRNGCMTQKSPPSSKTYNRIPKLLQVTLGTMNIFTIKVAYI
jgi:hypothetical protein